GVLHAGGIEDAFLQQVGVGLAARVRQGGAEQVEAEIGIEYSASGGKQQGVGLERRDLGIFRIRSERIVRRPVLAWNLARQARGLGDEVDQAERMAVQLRQSDIVAKPALQAVL